MGVKLLHVEGITLFEIKESDWMKKIFVLKKEEGAGG